MTSTTLFDHWPLRWRAEWISAPGGDDTPVLNRTAITPATERHPYEKVVFSRVFELGSVPAHVPARLTADSRYEFTVNGRTVGRGPVRSQPDRLHYDEYDLAGDLSTGRNEIEITVTYYGRPNAIWQPARGGSSLGDRATLAFEAVLGDEWMVTGAEWTSRLLPGWTTLSELDSTARVPFEAFDETMPSPLPAQAAVRPVNHMGGLAETHPPTMPYGRLHPRPIGALGGERIRPVQLRAGSLEAREVGAKAPLYRIQQLAQGREHETLRAVDIGTLLQSTPATPLLVEIDMGRIVYGYTTFVASSAATARISVALTEGPLTFRDDDPNTHVAGSVWVKQGGKSTFRATEKNGFRFAYLLVEVESATDLLVDTFEVHEEIYELAGSLDFTTSDTELTELYRAGRRTIELNSHDTFVDCPTREQRAWTGDSYVHGAVHLACSDDWRLVKRSLELGNSPRSDGLLPMAASSDLEYLDNVTIPDWSLYWIHGLHDYYRNTNDLEFLREMLPSAARIIHWYEQFIDPDNGLIGQTTEWNLVDWSAVFLDGHSSIINAMVGRALIEYADMSAALGNSGDEAHARATHRALSQAFEQFWDEDRGVYLDHLGGRTGERATSQLSNACAVVARFAPAQRRAALVAALSLGDHSVYRNWIGENGSYSQRRRQMHLRGIQEVDWDTETGVMRAEPFGSAIVHDALAALDAHDELVRNIRQWTVFLRDGYDTFGECWGFGTPCHGWSSYPSASLIKYVAGVTADAAGFESARIAPRYDLLPDADGSAPSPFGPIRVAWDEQSLTVVSPIPFRLVHPGGIEEAFEAGEFHLQRRATESSASDGVVTR